MSLACQVYIYHTPLLVCVAVAEGIVLVDTCLLNVARSSGSSPEAYAKPGGIQCLKLHCAANAAI